MYVYREMFMLAPESCGETIGNGSNNCYSGSLLNAEMSNMRTIHDN